MPAINPNRVPQNPHQISAFPPQNNKKIGIITRLFKSVAFFFTKIYLLFKYRDWYSEAKVKHLIPKLLETPKASDKIDLYNFSTTKKVAHVLGIVSKYLNLGKAEQEFIEVSKEMSPTLNLMKNMPVADNRLLFQIQGDEFGANNEDLEGYTEEKTLTYLSHYLTQRKKDKLDLYGMSDSIIEEVSNAAKFAQAENLDQFVNLVQSAINNHPNETILLPGGWAGCPGHAMVYEVIPLPNNQVTLRLFNLGGGAQGDIDPTDYKTKATPYIDFVGISRSKLSDRHILQAIFELNTFAMYPNSGTKTNFNEKDVYLGLKRLLKPNKIEHPSEDKVKTGQRSGVCSWRSLMAFLSSKMSENEYKRFACDIKMQSLLHREWEVINDKVELSLLEKSHEKVAHKVERLFKKNIISKSYLMRSEALLRRVESRLKELKLKSMLTVPFKKTQSLFRRFLSIFSKKPPSNNIIWTSHEIESQFMPDHAIPLHEQVNQGHKEDRVRPNGDLIHTITSYSLDRAIREGRNANAQGNYQTAHIALQKYIMQLDETTLNQPQDYIKLSKELGELAKLYFDTCFLIPEAEIVHPERVNALEKMLELQKNVAEKITPLSSEVTRQNYQPHKSLFFNPNDPVKGIVDPAYRYTPYFNRYAEYGKSSEFTFYQFTDFNALFQLLGDTHQELLNDPQYAKEQEYVQAGMLYMSDVAPQWFKDLRDTAFYLHYLNYEPVTNPVNKQVHSFNLKYEVDRAEKNAFKIHISLKEISGEVIRENPILAINRKSETSKFSTVYRPFLSEEIEKFVNCMEKHIKEDEKTILVSLASDHKIKMSDEHFKELAHIFVNPNKITEGFEYFYRHPEKLADPDYQILFEIFFFNNYHLKQELDIGFSKRINRFFKSQINHSLAANQVQKLVFLIRMSRIFNQFNPEVKNRTDMLKQLLNLNGLTQAEKGVVYAELVATLGKKEQLTPIEVEDLIVGTAFLFEHPVSKKWVIPQQNKEVREAGLIHSEAINTAFKGNVVNLLNRMSKELYVGDVGHQWDAIMGGLSPWFKSLDGRISYYPATGKMICNDNQVQLPLDIVQNTHFARNFKGVTHAEHGPNGVYRFTFNGFETLVKMDYDKVVIEQLRDGTWYRFVPKETFILPYGDKEQTQLFSRHLMHNYSHWQPEHDKSTVILVDNLTGKASYKASLKEDYLSQVSKIGSPETLKIPGEQFVRFEKNEYIQEWYHNFKSVQIELPRFGLSFTPDPKVSNRWHCDQFSKEGYYLAAEQSHPLMGAYTNYMVLESREGKKKLLLPEYRIKAPKQKMNAIVKDFIVDMNLSPEHDGPQTYLTFDITKDGLLENTSNSSKLFLASRLAAVQEYKTSAYYLRKCGSKLTPYTKNETESLKTIANMSKITGDTSGNGLALQVYATFLLLRNDLDHDHELSGLNVNKCEETYKNYLSHLKNATALKLTKEEELFLLKFFLFIRFDSVLFERLKTLDPQFAKTIQVPIPQTQNQEHLISFHQLKDLDITSNLKDNEIPKFENMLLTRINSYLATNPYEMYNRVKYATPEQKIWLEHAFAFGKKADGRFWSLLYDDIMKHPSDYDPLPKNNLELVDWWTKTKTTADANTLAVRTKWSKAKNSHNPKILDKKIPDVPNIPQLQVNVDIQIAPSKSFKDVFKHLVTNKTIKDEGSQSHLDWLEKEIKNPTGEPLYAKEIERLKDDMAYHEDKVEYSIKSLRSVKSLLNKGKKDNESKLKKLEKELIQLANMAPETFSEQLAEKMQLKAHTRNPLGIEELIISFAKKDPSLLLKQNPQLAPHINALFGKLGNYLTLSTHEQQRARALETLFKMEKSKGEERKDYEQLLCADLLASREYNPNERPAYLVFEYYANISMRKNQVEKLEKFLQDGETNRVMEMIMGSGKSKVLLPLLGLLKADGQNLSMLIVPQPLFESISSDTQRSLSDAFSQSLRSLHFHRNTKFDRSTLQRIRDDLKNVIKNKECLIITSKSIQCLLLKFIEEAHKENGGMSEELILMREILTMIAKSHPVIDEVDTVLNVLHEVCFSAGDKKTPDPQEIELVAAIYKVLYTDNDIKRLVRIESDPIPNKQGEELTEKNFHSKVKRLLAEKCLQLPMFSHLPIQNRNLALDYLVHENVANAQPYFYALSEEMQNKLALTAEQITNFLPHTLTRTCEEKYGLDLKNGGNIAIPYAAANTPNEGSLFANHYITMNYTFQYYIKKGISEGVITQEIERLQARTLQELKEIGVGGSIDKTEGWRLFKLMTDGLEIPLFNYNETQFNLLIQQINKNFDKKLYFIETFILPQLVMSEKKLSCNPQNLLAFFDHASGFTGTLWNQFSMHSKLTGMPEPGTDSKTLQLLWKKSKDEVYVLNESTPIGILKNLRDMGIPYDLISDAGGYLKEGGNTEIARVLSKFLGKPVVFYNKDNQQAIIENGQEVLLKDSAVPVDQRCTFLDQSHTTGSDVVQKKNAIGLVTISRNMLLRDLLQSVWRLRGLDKSQSVKFVISEEVHGIICQTLNKDIHSKILFEDILRFTIINQTKQQGIDNFKGLRQELNSLIQQLLFKVMLSPDSTEEQRKITIKELESEWIKNTNQQPKDLFGELAVEEDNAVVVKGEIKKFQNKIKDLKAKLPFFADEIAAMEEKVNGLSERLKDRLPAKILSPIRDIDDDQTVEIQQETEQETETQLEVNESMQPEKISLLSQKGYYKNRLIKIDKLYDGYTKETKGQLYFDLKTYLEATDDLKDFANAFTGIALTLNVLQWSTDNTTMDDLKLFGPYRTPFHQIQFTNGEAIIKSAYEGGDKTEDYNLGFGFYDPRKPLSPMQQEQIVKIKFLNGESNYSKEEAKILKHWIKQEGPVKMFALLQNHILAGMPDKIMTYNSKSTLMRIFDRCFR